MPTGTPRDGSSVRPGGGGGATPVVGTEVGGAVGTADGGGAVGGGGSIVITSSLGGLRGTPRISAYIASKHAVMGLMKSAALECASQNIRINTINPSPIATRMIEALEEGYAPGQSEVIKQKMEKAVPLRRYGQPEEVAQLALFLASDEASYITGNAYPVDGGMGAA